MGYGRGRLALRRGAGASSARQRGQPGVRETGRTAGARASRAGTASREMHRTPPRMRLRAPSADPVTTTTGIASVQLDSRMVLEYGPPVDPRHREVQHDDIGPSTRRLVEGRAAIGRGEHHPALQAQVFRIDQPGGGIVIDDQQRGGRTARAGAGAAMCVQRCPLTRALATWCNIVASINAELRIDAPAARARRHAARRAARGGGNAPAPRRSPRGREAGNPGG